MQTWIIGTQLSVFHLQFTVHTKKKKKKVKSQSTGTRTESGPQSVSLHLYRGTAAPQGTMGSQVYQVSQVNQDHQDIPHTVQGWAALCTFHFPLSDDIIHREKRTKTVSLTGGRVFFPPGHRIADGRSLGWQDGTSSHDKWHQGNAAVGIYSQQLAKWSLHFQKNQSNTVKLIFRRGFRETPCCCSCSIFEHDL